MTAFARHLFLVDLRVHFVKNLVFLDSRMGKTGDLLRRKCINGEPGAQS
jgi:hypothetical protein